MSWSLLQETVLELFEVFMRRAWGKAWKTSVCVATLPITWIWSRSIAYTRETQNYSCQCCSFHRTAVLLVSVLSVSVVYVQQNCSVVSVSCVRATELQCCQHQLCTCNRTAVLSVSVVYVQQNCSIVNISSLYLTLFQSDFVLDSFLYCPSISVYGSWVFSFHGIFCVTIYNVFFLFPAWGMIYLYILLDVSNLTTLRKENKL